MFEVNSCVMYGKIGVCQINGIKDGSFIGKPESKYYVLRPVYSRDLEIVSPVEACKSHMRELASEQRIFTLIESMTNQPPVWEDDSKLRNANFMAALNSGLCEEWIPVIKSLNQKSEEFKLEGKRLSNVDETMLKDTTRLLHEEFSHALKLQPDEIASFIQKRIQHNKLAS